MTSMKKAILGAALFALTSSASAGAIYNYERGSGVFGGNSGLSYDSVSATYDATEWLAAKPTAKLAHNCIGCHVE